MKKIYLLLIFTQITLAQPLTVLWDRIGGEDSSLYGAQVFSLGDQNGDGYADWGVNSPSAWPMYPQADASYSKVELFHGGNPPETQPYRVFTTDADTAFWIGGATQVGDLNGDGYKDWYILVDPTRNSQTLIRYFYLGGPSAPMQPIFQFSGWDQIGFEGIGDFNGDGYDDLFRIDFDHTTQMIFFGGSPMDTFPDWVVHDAPAHPQSAIPIAWGDLNGDGYADYIGANDQGGERVFWGSASPDTVPQIFTEFSTNNSTRFIVKDLNGDGRDELLVPHVGTLDVHLGSNQFSSIPDYVLQTPGGCPVSPCVSAGDINHDHYNDLITIGNGNGACDLTVFGVHLGHPWLNPSPAITVYGDVDPYELVGIYSGAGLGDVNGDGLEDFMIGCWRLDFFGIRGRAIIFSGDSTFHVDADEGQAFIPKELEVSIYPNPFNSNTTIEFEVPVYAPEIYLTIYNLLGQVVYSDHIQPASHQYRYSFNGSSLSSGIYLLKAEADKFSVTKKLMLLK